MNQNIKRINRVSLWGNKHAELLEPDYLFIASPLTRRQMWRPYDDQVHGDL